MSFRRLSRLAAPVSAGAVLLARAAAPPPELAECSYDVRRQGVSSGMHIELQKLRPREEQLRRKWEEDEAGFHKLPPRAWPPVQPKPEELPALQEAAAAADAPPQAQFDLATCLTFNNLDPVDGLRRYRELAKSGAGSLRQDAAVAVATVLLEGIGRDLEEESTAEGVSLLQEVAAAGHAQALYEVGVLHYLGSVPQLLAEDYGRAYACFEAAAAQQHMSANFMQAELLIEGMGVESDVAAAVPLLVAAAERGHRMARQYLRDFWDADAAQSGVAPGGSSMERARVFAQQLPQVPLGGSEHFAVFRGDGAQSSLAELLAEAASSDVVLLGECHDDPVAHHLEAFLLISLAAVRPEVVLSLEMFERDVQLVLDEYLAGAIREKDMLQDARPWTNYRSDYRPLVEFAKACRLPVVAANAPRRYVGAVGRRKEALQEDFAAVEAWPQQVAPFLPPLPLPAPSQVYMQHLMADPEVLGTAVGRTDPELVAEAGADLGREITARGSVGSPDLTEQSTTERRQGECPYLGVNGRDGLLAPVLLWDATMALSIARALQARPEALVVHVCGYFHCEKRVGIAEMLSAYAPQPPSTLVVAIYPEAECHASINN